MESTRTTRETTGSTVAKASSAGSSRAQAAVALAGDSSLHGGGPGLAASDVLSLSPVWTAPLGNQAPASFFPRPGSRPPPLQAKPDDGAPAPALEADVTGGEVPAQETSAAEHTTTPRLIIEDDAETSSAGQMRKSDFLAQLREAVCSTAQQALAGTEWSAAGCPWIDHWFGYYSNRDSAQIERAIRRYAPDTASVTSAADYIPIITERVRRAISVWAATGEITGVPEGISTNLPASAPEEANAPAQPPTSVATKARPGSSRPASSPQAVHSKLGEGRPLESGVRSRMEQAFGTSFAAVRLHTGSTAAELSDSLNARAFAVGQHVAFAPGEYQPGTLVGDALIAHELAHVKQQEGMGATHTPLQMQGGAEYNSLEEDADTSAVGAVLALWGKANGSLAGLARRSMPALKSGLRLSSCGKKCQKTPIISKTLAVYQLAGSTLPPAPEVGAANTIWTDAAGISLTPTFHPPVSEADTRALIGTEPSEANKPVGELSVDVSSSDTSSSTSEENALAAYAGRQAGADFTAFFVPNVLYGGYSNPPNKQVYIQRQVCFMGFTLAHELGHLILGTGHSRKWDSDLMHPNPGDCGRDLTNLECRMARGDQEAWREYGQKRSRR